MKKEIIGYYEKTSEDFDKWFDTHQALFQSEVEALKRVASSGVGLEIGVGTGRFADALGIRFGLDPAINMLRLAKKRGICVVQGLGESLPFKAESFDLIQIVFVIEFVDNCYLFLSEAVRALRSGGTLILGFIDRDSQWGRFYTQKPPYRKHFHPPSPEETLDIFKKTGLEFRGAYQTLLQPPPDISRKEEPLEGYGKGGFVVLKAIRT